MENTHEKPRWKDWENAIIIAAFGKNIHHKIIAETLSRTVSSVSHRIKRLSLRVPTNKRGRVKGKKSSPSLIEKVATDRKEMADIIQKLAPLEYREECLMPLQERVWTTAKAKPFLKPSERKKVDAFGTTEVSYTYTLPLDYILTREQRTKKARKKKIFGEPFYVPQVHVEKWAFQNGFYQVTGSLHDHGVSYWKEGRYFTFAQLLIFVNQIRHERKLQPLAIEENEEDLERA